MIHVTLSLLDGVRQSHSAPFSLEKLISALDVTNKVRHDRIPHGLTEDLTFPLSQQDGFEEYVESLFQIVLASQPSPELSSPGSTTHVSVMDKSGNAASVTTTNGEGCGSILPKYGMDIEEATGAPRVHSERNVLHLEPGVSEKDLTEMTSRYTLHHWDRQNLFFGGAHSATAEKGAGASTAAPASPSKDYVPTIPRKSSNRALTWSGEAVPVLPTC